MAVPTLKLDLAPPSNLWRMNHALIGWAALACGSLLVLASLGLTWKAYAGAAEAGRRTVTLVAETSRSAEAQRKVLSELRNIDVAKELPRWRLAEKIFTERSLPWSRLTAELERSLVVDVRLKSVQRTRGSDQKVQMKIRGEARSRKAEAAFVESLQKNAFFEQVLLEREAERQGGGVDFEYTLAAPSTPPVFTPLPKQPKYAAAATPLKAANLPKTAPLAVPAASPRPRPQAPAPILLPSAPAPAALRHTPAETVDEDGTSRRVRPPRPLRVIPPGGRPAPPNGGSVSREEN